MAKVANKWLDDMPTNTLKGNDTGSAGVPKDLTVSEARSLLNISASETHFYARIVTEIQSANAVVPLIQFDNYGNVMVELSSEGDM